MATPLSTVSTILSLSSINSLSAFSSMVMLALGALALFSKQLVSALSSCKSWSESFWDTYSIPVIKSTFGGLIIHLYIAPNKSYKVIPRVLHMVHYYYPSSGHALWHSFVRGSHLLPSELPGEHTGHEDASRCSEPIWKAHYSSTNHHCQVPILHLGEVRHTWSSHIAQCYIAAN